MREFLFNPLVANSLKKEIPIWRWCFCVEVKFLWINFRNLCNTLKTVKIHLFKYIMLFLFSECFKIITRSVNRWRAKEKINSRTASRCNWDETLPVYSYFNFLVTISQRKKRSLLPTEHTEEWEFTLGWRQIYVTYVSLASLWIKINFQHFVCTPSWYLIDTLLECDSQI